MPSDRVAIIKDYAVNHHSFTIPDMIDDLYPGKPQYQRFRLITNFYKTARWMERWGMAHRIGTIPKTANCPNEMVIWSVEADSDRSHNS